MIERRKRALVHLIVPTLLLGALGCGDETGVEPEAEGSATTQSDGDEGTSAPASRGVVLDKSALTPSPPPPPTPGR